MIKNKSKWAVILCGGRGSRMGELTDEIPKPLIQVHGKPILWYAIMTLYEHGFRNFILPLGYKGSIIQNYVETITKEIECNVFMKNTGDESPIAHRIDRISNLIPENEDFFLLNSDTIFDFNIEEMYNVHKKTNALVTLSSVEVISSWGLIIIENNEIIGFDRKRKVRSLTSNLPGSSYGLVNSGLAWLNKDALSYVDLLKCKDFETSLYQEIIHQGRASHYQIHGCWFPIDTPKDLQIINYTKEDYYNISNIAKAVRDKFI